MKSVETKFAEAMVALKKAGKVAKFEEVSKTCTTIESKLVAAESVLGTVKESTHLKLEDIEEAKRDYSALFGVEPRQTTTTKKEAVAPIKKNNGAAETFVEGNPFNSQRGSSQVITETNNNTRKNPCAGGDKIMFDSWLKAGEITEAQHSSLTGQKPEGYDALTEQQKKDFDFARKIGISEADAFKLTKITGTNFREVSRR